MTDLPTTREPSPLPRVEVTRTAMRPSTHGLYAFCTMQVCAVADASDEEILRVCNAENPSGVNPWDTVVRTDDDHKVMPGRNPCAEHAGRFHYLVLC